MSFVKQARLFNTLQGFCFSQRYERGLIWVCVCVCGDKKVFIDLNEGFIHRVKLGNNSKMSVEGKGRSTYTRTWKKPPISNTTQIPIRTRRYDPHSNLFNQPTSFSLTRVRDCYLHYIHNFMLISIERLMVCIRKKGNIGFRFVVCDSQIVVHAYLNWVESITWFCIKNLFCYFIIQKIWWFKGCDKKRGDLTDGVNFNGERTIGVIFDKLND